MMILRWCAMCGRGPLLEYWHQSYPVDRVLCTYDAKTDQRDTYPRGWEGTFHPASGAVETVSSRTSGERGHSVAKKTQT